MQSSVASWGGNGGGSRSAGGGGASGIGGRAGQTEGRDKEDEVVEGIGGGAAGLGVPASCGRLVIGCTTPVLHAVTARATVRGHTSLVPLSCFPGPQRIRLVFGLLQSPDGHEVAAVEKEGLLALLTRNQARRDAGHGHLSAKVRA